MAYFDEDEPEDLRKIRSEILAYRTTALMNDRERAAFLGLPEGCRMRENAKIISPENLVCGTYVWIGENAVLDASGGLEIGDNTQVGLGVCIWSHSSHRQARAGETAKDRQGIARAPTKIGKNCFIGGPAVIAPGVTIGDRVIISPVSFVDRDLPDGAVFGGNHERRKLEERIESLEMEIEHLKGNAPS